MSNYRKDPPNLLLNCVWRHTHKILQNGREQCYCAPCCETSTGELYAELASIFPSTPNPKIYNVQDSCMNSKSLRHRCIHDELSSAPPNLSLLVVVTRHNTSCIIKADSFEGGTQRTPQIYGLYCFTQSTHRFHLSLPLVGTGERTPTDINQLLPQVYRGGGYKVQECYYEHNLSNTVCDLPC